MSVKNSLPLASITDTDAPAGDVDISLGDSLAYTYDQNSVPAGARWFDSAVDQFFWGAPTDPNDLAGDANLVSGPSHLGSGNYVEPIDLHHAPVLDGTLDELSGSGGVPDAYLPPVPTPASPQTTALLTPAPVTPAWMTDWESGSSGSGGSMHEQGPAFVLVDGDGQLVQGPGGGSKGGGNHGGGKHGGGSTSGSNPGGGSSPPVSVSASASPFQIDISYDFQRGQRAGRIQGRNCCRGAVFRVAVHRSCNH